MIHHHGTTHVTHQAFPQCQITMVKSKIKSLINLRLVRRPIFLLDWLQIQDNK